MKKIFLILSAFLILFASSVFVEASGIVHLKVGENFSVNAKSATGASNYQWILKDSTGQILTKGKAQSFSYNFVDSGTYLLNLSVDMRDGSTKTTSVDVLVTGEGLVTANVGNNLFAKLNTLPQKSAENTISLEGERGDVYFIANSSIGEIKEYYLDLNLAEDSNHDGDPANDIDNKGHTSLTDGSAFKKTFLRDDGTIEVGLTVIDKYGKKDTDKVKVLFVGDDVIQVDQLEARISTFPSADEKGLIHLYENENKVTFYTGSSVGDIVEYRIDKNIKIDSDADGDPANDIDNKEDNSFYTGDMWTTEYNKEWGDAVMQLTVVDKEGKGSRIQRKVVFEEGSANIEINLDDLDLETVGKLVVDKNEIDAGDTINFTVFPAPENAKFAWDFDSDGIIETETQEATIAYMYESAGDFEAMVTMTTEDQELVVYKKKIIVHALEGDDRTQAPRADFTYFIDKNVVTFSNGSEVDSQLPNTEFISLWDFGNGEISSEQSPIYEYKQHGRFRVVLTVTDIAEKTSKKVEIIEIPLIEGLTDEEGGIKEGEVLDDGVIVEEDGTKVYPDGTRVLIDGTTIKPDGTEIKPDGTIINSDGSLVESDGTTVLPDGTIINPDGTELTETEKDGLGFFVWFLIILLIIVLIPAIYLVIEKIRNPALTFGEIIEGIKEKFTKKHHIDELEISTSEPEEQVATGEIVEPVEQEAEIEAEPVEAEPVKTEESQEAETDEPAPLNVQDGEMPEWLKNADESVDALENSLPQEESAKEDEVPDWLHEEDEAEEEQVEDEKIEDEFVLPPEPEVKQEESVVEPKVEPEVEKETKEPEIISQDSKMPEETVLLSEPAIPDAKVEEQIVDSNQAGDDDLEVQDNQDLPKENQPNNNFGEKVETPDSNQVAQEEQAEDQLSEEKIGLKTEMEQDLPDWLKNEEQEEDKNEIELSEENKKDEFIDNSQEKIEEKAQEVQEENLTEAPEKPEEIKSEEEIKPEVESEDNAQEDEAEKIKEETEKEEEEEGEILEEPAEEVVPEKSEQTEKKPTTEESEESDWQEIPPEESDDFNKNQ